MTESQNMGPLINIARILIFAFSLVCFTIGINLKKKLCPFVKKNLICI